MGIPELKELIAAMIENPTTFFCTLFKGVATVIFISLMGWIFLAWPEPQPAPHFVADKGEIIRLTPAAMAEQTAQINAEMEKRSGR
jgi:hypothetical protein